MATTAATPWGQGLSQHDLMEKDTVIVVDDCDNVTGSASKKDSHVFRMGQPHGILHRAFSVFLFDQSDGRLLLHQRSADKITFPNVWTNTCCSHPLHGMTPSEVDSPAHVANGTTPGVKNAAIRKLAHELGIVNCCKTTDFKFLTRLHYWAADTVTHGTQAPWGEHEIDYVLFWVVPHKDAVKLQPNPEEIQSVRWVNATELETMLADDSLLFSPWFRLIYHKWLKNLWWKDLNVTMTTDKFVDELIYEFDPPAEHFGGGGNAKPLFLAGGGDQSKKQGAYGKVTVHSESKLSQVGHVDEVFAALSLLYLNPLQSNLQSAHVKKTFDTDDLAFCDQILVKVSRSFAAVIRQLPDVMLVDVLVFYLVLRALDTIEDDTSAFPSHAVKIEKLNEFHQQALSAGSDWSMSGVGEGDERRLLENFPQCQRVFQQLPPVSQAVIKDITVRMADGMAEFVSKDLGQGTKDVLEYNRYCHFVAGLVGEGLSRLFAASGLESPSFESEQALSNEMGLFLQKTNIIRDYLEDYVDKRAFWPQTVWKKYARSGELGYFTKQNDPTVRKDSLCCLNELVTDALELVPSCLDYLAKLQCVEVFRFCAIPQVMAIATLDKVYCNSDVFTGVVKIRKGLSCKLILRTNSVAEVHETFHSFAGSILKKLRLERETGFLDPSYDRTLAACTKIQELTEEAAQSQRHQRLTRRVVTTGLLVAGAVCALSSPNAKDRRYIGAALMAAATTLFNYGPWSATEKLRKAGHDGIGCTPPQ